MTTFKIVATQNGSQHMSIKIYAGKDPDHLVYTGAVTMLNEEANAFKELFESTQPPVLKAEDRELRMWSPHDE